MNYYMEWNNFNQRCLVHSPESVCRTIIGSGGNGEGIVQEMNRKFLCCASRGRPKKRHTQYGEVVRNVQQLEVNTYGTTNTITSVEKDNYVLEIKRK